MKTDIYIISGFLGTGKITLVDRLLREVFDPREAVMIENDFGEASLDTSLICSGGFAVRELSAGHICYGLTGNFWAAIPEVLRGFSPEQILIELSGVGRLSDIKNAYRSAKVADIAQIRHKITVADVVRCRMYLDDFEEFYEDQIRHADATLLSHTEQNPDEINRARTLLAAMAPKAQLFVGAWKSLDLSALFDDSAVHATDYHEEDCHHDHLHEHHHHDGECDHDHSAHEAFDTVILSLSRMATRQELETAFRAAETDRPGSILHAKDVVNTSRGPATVQYLPGELNLIPCTLQPGSLCLIGSDLHEQELRRIFGKE